MTLLVNTTYLKATQMNPVKDTISIIIPCYNEEESVYLIYKKILSLADKMQDVDFEFVFIDDGSKDNTLIKIKNIRKEDSRVRYLSFSRNFGKESAMYAGLSESNGDYAVIIDADLQHHPKYINHMYLTIKEKKCDCACNQRDKKQPKSSIKNQPGMIEDTPLHFRTDKKQTGSS